MRIAVREGIMCEKHWGLVRCSLALHSVCTSAGALDIDASAKVDATHP
jgi:hypothetical protein